MHFGPAWDFDLSLDNDNRLYPTNSLDTWIFNFGLSSGTFRQFISKLMSCEKTLNSVQQKWRDITGSTFTKENVFNSTPLCVFTGLGSVSGVSVFPTYHRPH
jgi:hypothetical protein